MGARDQQSLQQCFLFVDLFSFLSRIEWHTDLTSGSSSRVLSRGCGAQAPPPTLATLGAEVVHADNPRIASLRFPTEGRANLLNKINDNIVRTCALV